MKKIDRLHWIQSRFGADAVMPYRYCETWSDITAAIEWAGRSGFEWGMRTDTRAGQDQGYLLPFLFDGQTDAARKIYDQHGDRLYYIVSERLPIVLAQGVALLLDDRDSVFIELNAREHEISQRDMYRHPHNLTQFAVGHGGFVTFGPQVYRCINPLHVRGYSLDRVHEAMTEHEIEEVTFSIKIGGQLVVW